MKIKKLMVVVLVFTFILLIGCNNTIDKKGDVDLNKKTCSQDSDCVKSSCCHAADVVNKENAPNCSGIMCTQVCQPGTLDCGQGKKKCLNGICTAILDLI